MQEKDEKEEGGRRGAAKSSGLDKETRGVLVKGTRVSGVRQSANGRLLE